MRTIGLATNSQKREALELTVELVEWLRDKGVRALLTEDVGRLIGMQDLAATEEELAASDLLLVLGGDGTMLSWGRKTAPRGTPLMGINFGHYGFITEIGPTESIAALECVLSGEFHVSERVMLRASLSRGDRCIGTHVALNDVVVSKGPLARMLDLHTYVNGKFLVTHSADGIIVASPTGSTAYSLSAGGPVVHPDVSVLVITPICPHTLSARSLVVPDDEKVKIMPVAGKDAGTMMLTIDGQLGEHLQDGDAVEIMKADFKARLVQVDKESFYNKLRTRLRWGERA